MTTKHKVYKGRRDEGTISVTVNGRPLRCIGYHSDEFNWGYGGSGAAELALAILANHFGERPKRTSNRLFSGEYQCWYYHQDFKRDFIAGWGNGSKDSWELTSDQITAWLATAPPYNPSE